MNDHDRAHEGFEALGGKVEWRQHGAEIRLHPPIHPGGFWGLRAALHNMAVIDDHTAACLVERAMRDKLKKAGWRHRDTGIVHAWINPLAGPPHVMAGDEHGSMIAAVKALGEE